MWNQRHISPRMRSILVAWMWEVCVRFELTARTFLLAVAYTDKFIHATDDIERDALQLVGVASLLLGSKFEEIMTPVVDDFVYICDNAYSRSAILGMERTICVALDYLLDVSTALHKTQRQEHAAVLMCVDGCIGSLTPRVRDRTIRGLSRSSIGPIRRSRRVRSRSTLLLTLFPGGERDKKIGCVVIDDFYAKGRSMQPLAA